MLVDFIRNHRMIATALTILVAGFVVFGLYIIFSRIGTQAVPIQFIPNDTVLTIDGEQHGEGTAFLKPGTYTVHASREGFQTYEGTLEVGESLQEGVIDLALQPASEEAIQWQEENMKLYLDHEGRSGERAIQFGTSFQEKFPITAHLPFRNFMYSIGHRLKNVDNPSEGIVIEITAITGSRNVAVEKIRELGFEPTDYEINFSNFENPFSHE